VVGCSERFVREVVNDRNRKCESDNVVPVPGWITRRDLQAAFRKLPADERGRLEPLPGAVLAIVGRGRCWGWGCDKPPAAGGGEERRGGRSDKYSDF